MDGRPTWTDCDESGDYVVPNVLSPRDLVSRPDIMDETVPHTSQGGSTWTLALIWSSSFRAEYVWTLRTTTTNDDKNDDDDGRRSMGIL